LGAAAAAAAAAGAVVSYFTGLSMSGAQMMIEGMQISVHTPMIGITPPFVLAFLQEKMLTIAAFDMIPEPVLLYIWGFKEEESDENGRRL
jgi:hypothetical protein